MAYATVLFDVDGTLLDTREFVFSGFEHALGVMGLPVPGRAELAARVGPPLEAIYEGLAGAAKAEALTCEHRAFQMRNVDLAVPFDGALDTLRALAERGLRLAAVTSRSRVTSVDSLRHCGLLDALEVVISAEDAEALKPDPRHLQAALSAMGVGCEGAVMVGDTPADIQGGRNLGVHTVAALYGFHGAAVESAQPDDTIDDIRELVELLGERCAFANSGDSLE